MTVKILSCILILFSSAGIGFTLSDVLKKRVRFLNEFKRTITYTENIISYKNEVFINTISDVCKTVKKDVLELYLLVHNALKKSYNFYNKEFRNELEKLLESKALTKEDIGVITDYFSDVGHYDKQHQIKSINEIKQRLDMQISDAKKRSNENAKLYMSFSLAAGVFICIIML